MAKTKRGWMLAGALVGAIAVGSAFTATSARAQDPQVDKNTGAVPGTGGSGASEPLYPGVPTPPGTSPDTSGASPMMGGSDAGVGGSGMGGASPVYGADAGVGGSGPVLSPDSDLTQPGSSPTTIPPPASGTMSNDAGI